MIEKLEKILARYDELGNALADPATLSDMEKWKKFAKERSDIEEAATVYRILKEL